MSATVCASLLLVPSASILGDAIRWSVRMEDHSEMVTLASSCAEQVAFELGTNFQSGQSTGNFASQGFTTIRYSVQSSDRVVDGGIPNRWMMIRVEVWKDTNGNGVADGSEVRHQLVTGLARR